jgi:endoglucanase
MRISRRGFVAGSAVAAGWTVSAGSVQGDQQPSKKDFVRVHGTKLIAPGGEKLMLRGINLGNWFVQEGYMFLFEGGPQSEREIQTLFNELIGPDAARAFWVEYRKRYIAKADIDFIQACGLNSVRIPLHYKFFLDSNEGFQILDPVIEWCRAAGLWVVLDMHCAPGGQTGTNIDDSWGYPWLYESAAEQEQTAAVWRRIAEHYATEPAVLGYDLLNEPNPQFPGTPPYNERLKAIYKQITTAIREVDRNHIIILGGAQWDTNFGIFDWPIDSKVMYTFHSYWGAPKEETIQAFIDFRDRDNSPLWLGESGENTDAWIQQFVAVLEKNHVGWCFWPYKKLENRSCMVSVLKPTYWDDIVAFAKTPGGTANAAARTAARPSLEHARQATQALLENIRFENCRVNAGYIQALGMTVPASSAAKP